MFKWFRKEKIVCNFLPTTLPNKQTLFSKIQKHCDNGDYQKAAEIMIKVFEWCNKENHHLVYGKDEVLKEAHFINRTPKGSDRRKKQIEFLIKRDGANCFYCKSPIALIPTSTHRYATIDHVIPKSKNGSNKLHNLVIACADCNIVKADKI